jgi:hypothetical protein
MTAIVERRESDVRLKHMEEKFDLWMSETRTHRESLDRRLEKIEKKQDCHTKTLEEYKPFLTEEMKSQKNFADLKNTGVKAVVASGAVVVSGGVGMGFLYWIKKQMGL